MKLPHAVATSENIFYHIKACSPVEAVSPSKIQAKFAAIYLLILTTRI